MTLSRDGMLCDQPTQVTASIFNYTIQGLTFQGRPVVADGSSWWLYMGAAGAQQAQGRSGATRHHVHAPAALMLPGPTVPLMRTPYLPPCRHAADHQAGQGTYPAALPATQAAGPGHPALAAPAAHRQHLPHPLPAIRHQGPLQQQHLLQVRPGACL